MNSLFLSVLLALLLRIDSLGKASAVMRSVFRLGRGHYYLVARIVIDVDSYSPELRPVLTEKLSFRPLSSYTSNLLCHVRSRNTYLRQIQKERIQMEHFRPSET